MTLSPGTRLGPYEILAPIGAGGMGEVYRARDTRLDRQVAVKILPPEFAQDSRLKLRFDREAKTISRLSHPHICTLFDVGEDYIVMELLDGESLSDRVGRGPLPLFEVLKYGMQISEALGKAHRQGIVHRDLKPANIMLTKSGAKLLDFGLAKTTVVAPAPDGATAQKPLTEEGAVVGTFQYMAPEQLAGEEPDARTDIFALGAVLYEMATGRRAFEGRNRTSLIAAIVSSDPVPMTELQPLTPPVLEHLVRKCLAKDPDDRWQSATDVAEQLRWISEAGSQAGVAAPLTIRRRTRERLTIGFAAVMTIATAVLGSYFWSVHSRKPPLIRLALPLPKDFAPAAGIAMSPDGRRMVVALGRGGPLKLWLRPLDSTELQALPGTEGGRFPFFSPDGKFVAFFADKQLKKISVNGGPPQTICAAPDGRGGSWSSGGTILFTPDIYTGLSKVPASGGTPVVVTTIDPKREVTHRWPSFLPDGRHFLYSLKRKDENDRAVVMVGSLDEAKSRPLLEDASFASYVAPGWLVFARPEPHQYSALAATMMAAPFDLRSLKVTGEPLPVTKTWYFAGSMLWCGAAVENGPLVYAPFIPEPAQWLRWVDAHGVPLGTEGQPEHYDDASLSPDGKKIAFDLDNDIWIHDVGSAKSSRFTFRSETVNSGPRWSPDGRGLFYVTFSSLSHMKLWSKKVDPGAKEEVVYESPHSLAGFDVSPDGKTVVIGEQSGQTGNDVMLVDVLSHRAVPFIRTPAEEFGPSLSPDGKWIAFNSNSTIFVRRFPDTGEQWQVAAGAHDAQWSRNGKTLFYMTPAGLTAVPVTVGSSFSAGTPQLLFACNSFVGESSDGKRYLTLMDEATTREASLQVILNWQRLLENP